MIHKLNFKHLTISLIISLGTGILSELLTMSNMQTFDILSKLPLSPPSWLFPIIWLIFFVLMGISAYLIYEENPTIFTEGIVLYGIQLAMNFVWFLMFFNAGKPFQALMVVHTGIYLRAFCVLIALWLIIAMMIMEFAKVNRWAARLQIPYLLWMTFMLYVNFGIFLLN